MGVMLLINRGPVEEIIEAIFERVLCDQQDYYEWMDFPVESFPPALMRAACDDMSRRVIEIMNLPAPQESSDLHTLGSYIKFHLSRFNICLSTVRYVYISNSSIELTLEKQS